MLAFEAASVHPFPGGGAVLPLPIHTIYAAQHPEKPVHQTVHIYPLLVVCGAGILKIPIPEYLSNALAKKIQTLDGCRLANVEVLVEHVGRASVRSCLIAAVQFFMGV